MRGGDYKVNLKTEILIEDLHNKVNRLLARQEQLEKMLKAGEEALRSPSEEKKPAEPSAPADKKTSPRSAEK